MARKSKDSKKYNMSKKMKSDLNQAISKYNSAVRQARKNAGFTDWNIDGLAMPTTLANTIRRIENTKQAKQVIKNLLEFTKPGMLEFDVKTDDSTGEVTDIKFKAQTLQIERQTKKENKIRRQSREFIIRNQDKDVYNPQIRYTLPDVTEAFIEQKHGTSPVELGTMEPVVTWRTDKWKENYIKRLQKSLDAEQAEHGVLESTVQRINNIINAIQNASVGEINLAIYGTTLAGDIREGPYQPSISLYLDTLEAEWNQVLGGVLTVTDPYLMDLEEWDEF